MSQDMRTPAPQGRLPYKFRTLAPTIFRPVILRTFLFLAFFVCTLTWIFVVVSPTSLHNSADRTDRALDLLIATFAALVINYLGCSLISRTLFSFGAELRAFSLFSSTRLWPLGIRLLAFPLTMALVGTPVLAALLLYPNGPPLSNPWLFCINLALLHVFFCIGSAFVGINPTYNRVLGFLIKAALPFRLLSSMLGIGTFWLVFILFQLIRSLSDLWNDVVLTSLRDLAASADSLLHVTAIGPLILFWLNPYYLLVKLHSTDGFGLSAQISFAALCILASGAMAARLRTWIVIDLDERSRIVYDDWLQFRQSIQLVQSTNLPQNSQSQNSVQPAFDFGVDPDSYSDPSGHASENSQKHFGAGENHYELPVDITAESYISSLRPQRQIFPGRIFTAIIITAMVLSFLYSPWTLFVAVGIWLLVTSDNLWNISKSANLFPLRVVPELRSVFRQRLLPLVPVDVMFAILVTYVLDATWHNFIPFTALLIGVRPAALALAIVYVMQSKAGTTLTLIFGLAYLFIALAALNVNVDTGPSWVAWQCSGIGLIILAMSCLVATWQLWKTNWLQHTGV